MRIALTIAGSDSGGGAGIQADLKTFQAFGCHGTSVIVAVTAQNTLGVRSVHPIPAGNISDQLAALAHDLPADGCKSGMLATTELVNLVADHLSGNAIPHYVLDPVMVASSGDRLLDSDAVLAVRERLLPLSTCVTPNLDEAELLTGLQVRDVDAMVIAGQALLDLGAQSALVKGGHLASDIIVDVLVTHGNVHRFTRRRTNTRATHGTGCTLSAGIAANLALGVDLMGAVTRSLDYLQDAIRLAVPLGRGHGPVNHAVPVPPIS